MIKIRKATYTFMIGLIASFATPYHSPASAAQINADSEITAVTVFPDRAMITRTAKLNLAQGSNEIIIGGLPAGLQKDSIRVKGKFSGSKVQIGSIDTKDIFKSEVVGADQQTLTNDIEKLNDRKRTLDDKIKVQRAKLKFINEITIKNAQNISDTNGKTVINVIKPGEWKNAWDILSNGAAEVYNAIQNSEIEIREIDKQIKQKQHQLSQLDVRKRTVQSTINLSSKGAANGNIEISYMIGGAYWRPVYDARLNSRTSKINLQQKALVWQKTGEDWDNVDVTFSTSTPSYGAVMPKLPNWVIGFMQPRAERKRSFAEKASFAPPARQIPPPPALLAKEIQEEALYDADMITAQAKIGDFSAEYIVSGKSSIKSDDTKKKLALTSSTQKAKLEIHATPKIKDKAFLFAKFTYDGKTPLSTGKASIYRDGAFIGNGHIPLTRPDEEVELSFGVDDKVKVTYNADSAKNSEGGIIEKDKIIDRKSTIIIENYHKKAREITIYDSIPVSKDEEIIVELQKDGTSKPTPNEKDDPKSMIKWKFSLEPSKKKELNLHYRVIYPKDKNIYGL